MEALCLYTVYFRATESGKAGENARLVPVILLYRDSYAHHTYIEMFYTDGSPQVFMMSGTNNVEKRPLKVTKDFI